jgi:hypothetical protein
LRRRPARLSTQDAGWHVKERAMNLMWWAEHSFQLALLLLTAVATHFYYSKDRLASLSYIKNDGDGNNTPFFLIPVTLMILLTYFIFPFEIFLT